MRLYVTPSASHWSAFAGERRSILRYSKAHPARLASYPIRWIYQARMRIVANQSATAPMAVAAPLKKA